MEVLANNTNVSPGLRDYVAALPRLFRPLKGVHPGFAFLDTAAAERPRAERYVAEVFQRAYGARVTEFAPYLFTMTCAGAVSSVAGVRPAADSRLFLEQYLDPPVEQVLEAVYGREISRSDVFELCNLAALRPGACQLLYVVLANIMHHAGYKYTVFAGTRQVVRVVNKLNFVITDIGPADPARLGGDAKDWGRYYATDPRVVALDIEASLQRFAQLPLQGAIGALFAEDIAEQVEALASLRFRPALQSNAA